LTAKPDVLAQRSGRNFLAPADNDGIGRDAMFASRPVKFAV
jgi:hypothetical protein